MSCPLHCRCVPGFLWERVGPADLRPRNAARSDVGAGSVHIGRAEPHDSGTHGRANLYGNGAGHGAQPHSSGDGRSDDSRAYYCAHDGADVRSSRADGRSVLRLSAGSNGHPYRPPAGSTVGQSRRLCLEQSGHALLPE
jgi:hypothetical protein